MNTIELQIKETFKLESNEFRLFLKLDKKPFFTINEEDINAIVFEELENSLKGDGSYLIFTCYCGVADCGGWKKVIVRHNLNTISWLFNYNTKDYFYEFDSKSYQNEIENVRLELDNLKIKLEPQCIFDPE